MNQNLLMEIRDNPCALYDTNGNVVDYANCRVETSSPAFPMSGQTNAVNVVPHLGPTLTISKVHSGNLGVAQSAKSLRAAVRINGIDFYEVVFNNLQNSGTLKFTFDPSKVDYLKSNETRYEEVLYPPVVIDWANIKLQPGNKRNDQAFEDLCRDLITKDTERFKNHTYFPAGTDGGRDGVYYVHEIVFPSFSADKKCIIQCKYSKDVKTRITQQEIHNEFLKAQIHKPDYYILVTNRKTIPNFITWFEGFQNPFKQLLVQRDVLEGLIQKNMDVFHRYFT